MTQLKNKITEALSHPEDYVFARTPEGLTTVTLEPLLKQVTTVFNNCKTIDTSTMNENELAAVKFTLESTNQVYHFLSSLLTEAEIKLDMGVKSENIH
jgi:hypothetical protein